MVKREIIDIKELNLSDNNLTEIHIPIEIVNFTQLTILALFNNKLTQIPPEIGRLRQLVELYLSHNKLIQIPAKIGELAQLVKLTLSYNRLTQLPVEIGQLTQLATLTLSNNKLILLPVEIGKLTQLTTLILSYNNLTKLPLEIGQLALLTKFYIYSNPIENILNPIIQRFMQRLTNINTIYNDTQNVHSTSIQLSVKDSIYNLMNDYCANYNLSYLDWADLHQTTKEILTEYIECSDVHTSLNITFKDLFIAVSIEIETFSIDIQKEINQRLNEEMQESECKCFTGRICRLVNCLSGYSNKVNIQISESDEISNIISIIMKKRGVKPLDLIKIEVMTALKERGYTNEKINEWLAYVE